MANPAPRPLTASDRKLGLERRLTYSRSWYRKQLIAIAVGEIVVTATQFRALVEYGKLMGWYVKTRVNGRTQDQAKLPRITDELLARMQ
jgi:hypothetical protein